MSASALQNRFAYTARDPAGQPVNGFVQALTLAEATRQLRAEGKFILDVRPARAAAAEAVPAGLGSVAGRVRREEVIDFTLQLSVMVDTGVPLSDALTALSEQAVSPNFTAILKQIVADVTGGKDFSACLERYPRVFPRYYVSLVRASEMSGAMGPILRRLADYLVNQRETAKKIRGAMIYPAFMFGMSILVTVFLLVAVLPKFTAIFASRKAALPLPTQILMAISHSLLAYWYIWLGSTVIALVLGIWFFRTPRGRRAGDYLKLNTPIVGRMFHKMCLSRSLQTMGTMIQSGVQMLDCLQIVREVAGNSYYADMWEDVRERIQQGQQLSEPLLKNPLIPRSVGHMIHSGEKSGELPAVLIRVSAYMDDDLKTAIKTTTQFIEPVMIGMMGLLIGGVAIAMLLPILTISKVMSQG